MDPFDIFITFISWGNGGKSRPILVILVNDDSLLAYPITTQYKNKSKTIQAQYYKMTDWLQAGLNKQSYIDTGTLIKLPLSSIVNKKPIGRLSEADKQNLFEFLNK